VNEFFEGPVLDGRVLVKTPSEKLLISALLYAGRDTVRKRLILLLSRSSTKDCYSVRELMSHQRPAYHKYFQHPRANGS